MNMAKWRGERRSLSPSDFWSDQEWDADPGRRSFRHSLRSLSPLALSDLDFWDRRSGFKARKSPAWSCMGLPGSTLRSKISTSTLDSQKLKGSLGMTRSASRLAPEGAPRSHSSAEDFELRAALEESSMRRAELVQRLREAKGHLDTQTDLLKSKGSQLQQSQSISNILEMKHKQLSEAVSALEQDKEAAELSRFEESRRRGELHDKVLQLEMDILKMRSNLERRTPPTSPNPLNRTLPATKDETLREGQRQVEKEIKKLREALRKAEERIDDLEYEKDSALRQLHSSAEGKQAAIKQAEELEQRLSSSVRTQAELEDQLNESRGRLGQMELEKDLFSTKTRRLEDNLNDLKVKLSGALMDKDRLVQEKAELHQRIQTLDLQLQREQRSKQGFNEQVCELHSEISQAKSQASKQKMETMFMKEELLSIKELNEKLSSDLTKAKERLQVTLNQLHELEAQKMIQTNQIAALETERLQLIGEKEELKKTFDDGLHEKIRELGEKCCQHREPQGNFEQENQTLQIKCQDLEKKVQILEAEYKQKEEEHQHMRAAFEKEKEELRKVAAHWNERWLDVAMTLCSTQAELDELKSQQQENDKREADVLPLDDCRQQIEPERDRGHVQQRLMGSSVSLEDMDGELVQVKAELLKVKDMLKIRDTELEEQLQELQSSRTQVSQQSGKVQRMEQQLIERDQEIKEKDQDLKNLEIQRITEKAEAQIKISALEQEIFDHKEQQSREEVVSECSPEDLESLKALLEESKKRAERLEQERDQALQQLYDLSLPHQGKAEKESPPENKKQKPAGSDVVDPNQQRRLVTEQLKSLFREREQHGERSPVFPRRPGLVDSGVQNATSIKEKQTQKLQQDLQQGAAKGSSSQISVSQGGSKRSERGEEQKQPTNQKHHNKTAQDKSPLGCKDGTFLARQVEVCNSDSEDTEGSI
ncbi:hyaluronan mediated motility receptor-like isoform X3 [Megalobrama amblycephala]|uniref:hyaluronan mediated motility receptor-like isoform X3 n=1 Tax=Megalobrama amblycephala TaxID=75352 RepID=UPI0020145A19|nr:hyaluronan mediated motility receptor-like isoform X3 [Megalobrama amblycephala]